MNAIESLLYEISKFFLTPVLILLCLMFVFALFALGTLLFDWLSRALRGRVRQPLHRYAAANPTATQESLELHLLELIEPLRITSRIAPMLGLVATMIPMGPALIAVSGGNAVGMAENLVVAFSAVIVALLSAAITYLALTVRRRWLLVELDALLSAREAHSAKTNADVPLHLAGVSHG